MDYLLLPGGHDVAPFFYNESPHPETGALWPNSDLREFEKIHDALKNDRPIIGVCRGAQLLCIYAGGRLNQHIEGHVGCGSHLIKDIWGNQIYVNSIHHQAMIPSDGIILAKSEDGIPEVVFWKKLNAIGIQSHPEWDGKAQKKYFNKLIAEFLGVNNAF